MATIREVLAIAIQHHQAGRLQVAEQIYRRILEVEPHQPHAIHLLGLVASEADDYEAAIEHFRRAISLQGNVAVFHHDLGEAYRVLQRFSEAVASYRRALELAPDSADTYSNLGTALKDQGKLDEAADCYRRALDLNPHHVQTRNNLGVVFALQHKLDEAIACWRRTLELKPDFAEALGNLGAALQCQGNLDEAIACYREALKLTPHHADAQSNLANALKAQGNLDDAVECYRRAASLRPNSADAHRSLAGALRDQGRLDEAVDCFRRALDLDPHAAGTHNRLGNVLRDLRKPAEAAECYLRALELEPDFAEAHTNLGVVLKEQGRLSEAIACHHRAMDLKPDSVETHGNLGSILKEMGDLQAAEDSLRTALRYNPRFASGHYRLAELLGGGLPDEDLALQRRLLEDANLPEAQRLLLHFGLAYVLDARGEYAEAAGHLDRGNAMQLAQSRISRQEYDPDKHTTLVSLRTAVYTPEWFEQVCDMGSQSELPVFVVGLPRSGTTLIEQILASHSQVFGAGELTLADDTVASLGAQGENFIATLRPLDHKTASRLASQHLERLRALHPAALRIVDKMPDNYLSLGLLASLFPRARFIHCRRDLRDVGVSCWMTHFQEIRWANDQQHIASRFREYRRIMDHWHNLLPAPLLEVDYEETVADLEGMARKLVAWCGLDWEPACLEFHRTKRLVRTASAVQVRQPVYRTSIGRWKHYEQALAPLFAAIRSEPSP